MEVLPLKYLKLPLVLLLALLLTACNKTIAPAPAATPALTAEPAPEATSAPEAAPETVPEAEAESDSDYALPRYDFPAFTTTDLDGNAVSSEELFGSAKLTMVNLWATWCGPCVQEMPYLEQISKDYADKGFQLVGLVDRYANESDVRGILADTGATYPMLNWFDDAAMLETGYVPTTYFFDSEGRVIHGAYVGGGSYEDWSATIDEILKDVE